MMRFDERRKENLGHIPERRIREYYSKPLSIRDGKIGDIDPIHIGREQTRIIDVYLSQIEAQKLYDKLGASLKEFRGGEIGFSIKDARILL